MEAKKLLMKLPNKKVDLQNRDFSHLFWLTRQFMGTYFTRWVQGQAADPYPIASASSLHTKWQLCRYIN